MDTNQLHFWLATAFLFIVCLIAVYRTERIEPKGVRIPKHVPIGESDDYTPQQVFDWVVYVTKVIGKDYLEQLNWDENSRHNTLLIDLYSVVYEPSDEWRLKRFKEVGKLWHMDTSIVDEPV